MNASCSVIISCSSQDLGPPGSKLKLLELYALVYVTNSNLCSVIFEKSPSLHVVLGMTYLLVRLCKGHAHTLHRFASESKWAGFTAKPWSHVYTPYARETRVKLALQFIDKCMPMLFIHSNKIQRKPYLVYICFKNIVFPPSDQMDCALLPVATILKRFFFFKRSIGLGKRFFFCEGTCFCLKHST